jgi:hypothetical protein
VHDVFLLSSWSWSRADDKIPFHSLSFVCMQLEWEASRRLSAVRNAIRLVLSKFFRLGGEAMPENSKISCDGRVLFIDLPSTEALRRAGDGTIYIP